MANNIYEINEENVEEVLGDDSGILMIDFWAEWCQPCKNLNPVIEEVAQDNEDIKVGKINIDENKDLVADYGVRNIPTIMIFNNGQYVTKVTGAHPKETYQEAIDKVKEQA